MKWGHMFTLYVAENRLGMYLDWLYFHSKKENSFSKYVIVMSVADEQTD